MHGRDDILAIQLTANFDLSTRNTLALPSRAQYGAIVTASSQVEELVDLAAGLGIPLYVIGGGSNLVLGEDIQAFIAVMATKGKKVASVSEDRVLVCAQAGEDWSDFVAWSVAEGLAGLENMGGIPGTVGAAPVQNIGAYGVELRDRFHALTAYDTVERKLRTFIGADCNFSYRHSIFKEQRDRYIVIEVTFALPKPWRPMLGYPGLDTLSPDSDPKAIFERVLAVRASKLPDWRTLPNAGSFFHNPIVTPAKAAQIDGGPRFPQPDGRVKLSAAWLIDACGLKGAREGQAGIYDRHALIVVNHGGATCRDVTGLASRVRNEVLERFGIALVQEPLTLQ